MFWYSLQLDRSPVIIISIVIISCIFITASGLVGLVQPMLWNYTPDLDVDVTGQSTVVPLLLVPWWSCAGDVYSRLASLSVSAGEVPQCWHDRPMGSQLLQRLHQRLHLCAQHAQTRGQSSPVAEGGCFFICWGHLTGYCYHRLAKVRVQRKSRLGY